jgi:Papain-like cysteine protease AvrRpt2
MMHSIRGFFLAVLVFAASAPAFGQYSPPIGFIPGLGPVQRAQVDFNKFASDFSPQLQSEWCWAASISNVFAYYGHRVSQERIVKTVYGGIYNMPALTAALVAQQLNRQWVDDKGLPFRATLTAAYDAAAGVNAINNMTMINQLRAGCPIIVCNKSHCMVNTLIDFTPAQVVAVGVFDPWPGIGPRSLTKPEMVPATFGGELTFLATVRVR